MVSGSGIGTQVKDYDDGMWYKQNKAGYEGIAECLSSKVLACSNIRDFVMYHTCKINGKDGCVSKNFLRPTESYISIQRLYDIYYEGKLDDAIRRLDSVKERIAYVKDFILSKTALDITEYLGKMLTFDMLILNTDRHFNNFGIIVDKTTDSYRFGPVFDNGNALLSNVLEFPFDLPIGENIQNVYGKPFSAKLEIQALEAGFGLKVNYDEVKRILKKEKDSRALSTLMLQLDRYEDIIKDNSIVAETVSV